MQSGTKPFIRDDGKKARVIVRPYLDSGIKSVPFIYQPIFDVSVSYDIKGCALPESFVKNDYTPKHISNAFKNNKVRFVQIKTELSFLYDDAFTAKSIYFLNNFIKALHDRFEGNLF